MPTHGAHESERKVEGIYIAVNAGARERRIEAKGIGRLWIYTAKETLLQASSPSQANEAQRDASRNRNNSKAVTLRPPIRAPEDTDSHLLLGL